MRLNTSKGRLKCFSDDLLYIFHSNFEHIRFQIKKPLSDRGFSIFQKPDYFNLVSL